MEILINYALEFVGLAYRWGGDDSIGGFDCSGLVIELLQSVGIVPPKFDATAQGLYDLLSKNGVQNAYAPGSIVFYGKSVTSITHVAFLLEATAPFRVIEAGGGGSAVTSAAAAEARNAYVRIRPMKYRSDVVAVVKPFYFNTFK